MSNSHFASWQFILARGCSSHIITVYIINWAIYLSHRWFLVRSGFRKREWTALGPCGFRIFLSQTPPTIGAVFKHGWVRKLRMIHLVFSLFLIS